MSYLLRITLPDIPGSLGTVASAIGITGANIEAIEIVEHRSDGTAVDDVLLELPEGVMPDSVVSRCYQVDGVEVLWISRYTAGASLQLDLEAVEELTEEPKAAVEHLVQLVPTVFRADWAALVAPDGDGLSVVEATSAAPDLWRVRDAWLPMVRPDRLVATVAGEPWESMVAAGAPIGSDGQAVLMGRRGGPEFLDSELARLHHLVALASTIARG